MFAPLALPGLAGLFCFWGQRNSAAGADVGKVEGDHAAMVPPAPGSVREAMPVGAVRFCSSIMAKAHQVKSWVMTLAHC
jgi:hypothetical protein